MRPKEKENESLNASRCQHVCCLCGDTHGTHLQLHFCPYQKHKMKPYQWPLLAEVRSAPPQSQRFFYSLQQGVRNCRKKHSLDNSIEQQKFLQMEQIKIKKCLLAKKMSHSPADHDCSLGSKTRQHKCFLSVFGQSCQCSWVFIHQLTLISFTANGNLCYTTVPLCWKLSCLEIGFTFQHLRLSHS